MAGTRVGGLKTKKSILDKFGTDYYRKIGKRGGLTRDPEKTVNSVREKYGDDAYAIFGRKGGRGNKKSKIEKWLG